MAEEETIQLKIGAFQVGIIGLKKVIADLAPSLANASDGEIAEELIHRLSKKNYIPEKAKSDYAQALVREFRRSLGQEVVEPSSQGLTIRVLGLGCTNCRTLVNRVMEVLNDLNLTADLEHVTDIKKIAAYKVLGSPALVINDQVVSVGQVPNKKQIASWLSKE